MEERLYIGWVLVELMFAALTLVELAPKAFFHEMMEPVSQRSQVHLVDHFVDKGKFKQQLGFLLADASLSHIEQSSIVELSYGRPVGTFHIVGSVYIRACLVAQIFWLRICESVCCASFLTSTSPANAPTASSSSTYL